VIRIVDSDADHWSLQASMEGIPVYLDNSSIIDLSKRQNAKLRARFLGALHHHGTLLFSITNVIEILGPQGASSDAVKMFLTDIGPRWVPVDIDPGAVIRREAEGDPTPAISPEFLRAYGHERLTELERSGQAVNPLDPGFFDLGKLIDWLAKHRDKTRADTEQMDVTLRAYLSNLRRLYEQGQRGIDESKEDPLLPGRRATYVMTQLARMAIQQAKSHGFQPHDALDICHAAVALAYGLLVTLDKRWWRRANEMKHADKLARVYHSGQLELFVRDLETTEVQWHPGGGLTVRWGNPGDLAKPSQR
jgi:hypothetical protein